MIDKGMTVERFALVDDDGNHQVSILSLGKNIIGRGSVELKGISYVEISSPNCSVSRIQANIEICPNGDAWICDCNSTNGTFLAVNKNCPRNAENEMDHLGICLKEKYYYQLSEGCRITFGDVRRVFKRISVPEEKLGENEGKEEKQKAHPHERKEHAAEEKRAGRISSSLKTSGDPSSGLNTHPNTITSTSRKSHQNEEGEEKMQRASYVGHDVHLPYMSSGAEGMALLASSPGASTTMSVSRSISATTAPASTVAAVGPRRGKKTTAASEAIEVGAGAAVPVEGGLEQYATPSREHHRSRSTPSSSCSAPEAKKYRREEVQPVGRGKYSVVACLSGMEESEREEANKAVKKVGKVVDDITKASVLIVRLPAVRTPKFITAIGRGIPVVGLEGFKEWSAGSSCSDAEDDLLNHVVSLSHGKTEYSSATLRQSIAHRREEKNRRKKQGEEQEGRGLAPALDGHTFSLEDIPAKVKEVATDIITGCGGKVLGSRGRRRAGRENNDSTVIPLSGEAALGELYDRILRGNADFQKEKKT